MKLILSALRVSRQYLISWVSHWCLRFIALPTFYVLPSLMHSL
jgi:hypothetical protein